MGWPEKRVIRLMIVISSSFSPPHPVTRPTSLLTGTGACPLRIHSVGLTPSPGRLEGIRNKVSSWLIERLALASASSFWAQSTCSKCAGGQLSRLRVLPTGRRRAKVSCGAVATSALPVADAAGCDGVGL